RVLVVDDNLSNLRVASALLQSLGLNVDTATGGFQALSMIEKSRYDVVLLDCQMPDLSGFDVTESVRRAEAGTSTHVPIVALTAFTSKEMIDRCVHVGMDDFMAKPIDLDQMTTVIGRFITPSGVPKRRVDSENPSERDLGTMLAVDTQALDRLRKLSPPRGEFQSSSDVIEELIRLFTSNTDRTLARMRASVESGTAMELAEAAHSLKSSSTSVGAIRVTALLEKFEAIRHDARIPSETTSLLDQLETECEIARNEIISWWNETKSRASMLNGSPFAR
ncbi:MAG TPA: response regulator, partial [Bdellovibrionales bacterium]|nr:response regulator [Bdellovibrionales bacterium]